MCNRQHYCTLLSAQRWWFHYRCLQWSRRNRQDLIGTFIWTVHVPIFSSFVSLASRDFNFLELIGDIPNTDKEGLRYWICEFKSGEASVSRDGDFDTILLDEDELLLLLPGIRQLGWIFERNLSGSATTMTFPVDSQATTSTNKIIKDQSEPQFLKGLFDISHKSLYLLTTVLLDPKRIITVIIDRHLYQPANLFLDFLYHNCNSSHQSQQLLAIPATYQNRNQ